MKKLFLFVMFAVFLNITFSVDTEARNVAFRDINESYTYFKEIDYLVNEKIISGYPDGTFKPDDGITKKQAAVMLSRALNKRNINVKAPKAKDIKKSDSAYYEIATMISLGIFKNEEYFNPNKFITREEMAYALTQAYSLKWTSPLKFRDVDKKYWAYEYIDALAANGVTNGYPDGTFKPKGNVSRAHFALFLYRTIHNKIDLKKDSNLEQSIRLGMSYTEVINNINNPILKSGKGIDIEKEIYINGVKFGKYATIRLTFRHDKLKSILYNFRPENSIKEYSFTEEKSTSHEELIEQLIKYHGNEFEHSSDDFAHVSEWDKGEYRIVWANHNFENYTSATLYYVYKAPNFMDAPTSEIAWAETKSGTEVKPETETKSETEVKLGTETNVNKNLISIDTEDNIALSTGEQRNILVEFYPEKTDKEIIWTSSDSNIVRVDTKGNITAVNNGVATIRAEVRGETSIFALTTVTVAEKRVTLEEVKATGNSTLFQKYLRQNYNSLSTPLGEWKFSPEVTLKNNSIDISIDWNPIGPSPYDLKYADPQKEMANYGRILTLEERINTKQLLREYMRRIASDTFYAFPGYSVEGKFYTSYYKYSNLKVGYNSIRFLTWNNFNGVSFEPKLYWNKFIDDYDFILNQDITNVTFIHPNDGNKYDKLPPTIYLKKGETVKINLEITPMQDISDISYKELGWQISSGSGKLTFDDNWNVKAESEGKDYIWIFLGDKKLPSFLVDVVIE